MDSWFYVVKLRKIEGYFNAVKIAQHARRMSTLQYYSQLAYWSRQAEGGTPIRPS